MENLNPIHFSEIVEGSGVSDVIAHLNFGTITDPSEADELLNRNAKKRWQHSDNLVPAWGVAGVDPKTGERWLQGVQLKPDTPVERDGKPQKYLSASGYETEPLFLDNGEPDYWQKVLGDRTNPLFITEGAKKAACLLTLDHAAISLPGVWNAQLKGRLKTCIKECCGIGRKVNLCFDSDQLTNPKVQQALDRLGRLLSAEGCVVSVVLWNVQHKGIDDLYVQSGSEAVNQAIANALTFEEWRDSLKTETDQEPSGKPRLDIRAGQIDQAAHTVLTHFGSTADPRERIYAQGNSQGYTLVRVLKTVTGIESRYLHVSRDNDVLDPVTPESLQWEINRNFEIYRWVEKNGEPEDKRTDCPATLAKQVLAMGRWPQLPILRGLSYTPLLTKTGEVITQPGYYKGTGYLLQFDPADYSLKETPTKEDAIAALLTLKDLLSEFCFKTEVDRSAALSLLLTAISRKLYALAPLHAVNAHQPGTGKGTLINLACILATGNKEAGAASFTDNEEEMSKKVLSTLLSGTPIVNIDNVDRRLGGGTLERVLTAEFYKDRILGVSKNAVCSTQVLWTANGNNLAFTTDMTRRTVLIELDAGMESPETRTFSRDIEAYALEHRGKLVSAALTVLQAYLKAGSPVPTDLDGNPINPPPLGSFGGWDAVVRRALLWLGESDPVQSQATIRDGDDSRIALSVFLEAWYSHVHSLPGSTVKAYQARDIVQQAIATDGDFKHAVLEVCLDRQGQPSTKILGYYLRRNAGVVVNGYRLVRGQKTMTGVPWKVEKVQPTQKINQGEVSSSSSWGDTKKSPEPIQGNNLSAYDDAKSSSYPSMDSVAKSHDDKKVSSYKPEPLQTEAFSDSKQPLHDDDDDNQPRHKVKTEVIIDADDF
jgi:Domain of unknown function (DUF3854)